MAQASPTLSLEQMIAIDGVESKKFRIIKGSAGTGKSTVIAEIVRRNPKRVLVITPTYKTAHNLRKAGVDNVYLTRGFICKTDLQGRVLMGEFDYIIFDEASMLKESERRRFEIITENASMVKPVHVAYFGDPKQLGPISDVHRMAVDDFFVSQPSCCVLTVGFRQASDILVKRVTEVTTDPHAVTVCATNATRTKINIDTHFAKHGSKAYTTRLKTILAIHPGDRLVCYTTDDNRTYLNNVVYKVKKVSDHPTEPHCWNVVFEGKSSKGTLIRKCDFKISNLNQEGREKMAWEFAYAITAHTAQGSGFDRVVVHLEREEFINPQGEPEYRFAIDGDDINRWAYTAITRGIKQVIVFDPTNALTDEYVLECLNIETSFDQDKAEVETEATPEVETEVEATDDAEIIDLFTAPIAKEEPTTDKPSVDVTEALRVKWDGVWGINDSYIALFEECGVERDETDNARVAFSDLTINRSSDKFIKAALARHSQRILRRTDITSIVNNGGFASIAA